MEFSLLGAAAVGLGSLYAVLWWEAGRGNAADCTRRLWDLLLSAAIVGLVAGRVSAMLAGGTNPLTNPGDLLIVRGGVATGPAATAALLTAGLLARKDLRPTLDAAAPAALAGLAGWHAGCLTRSACAGTPTDAPWGITTAGGDIARHPVELYAAVLLAVAVIALIWWKRRHPPAGLVAGAALLGASVVRLATEPLRVGLGGGPEAWYAAGFVAAFGIIAVGAIRSRSGQP